MQIEIICTGDEVLTGKIVNTREFLLYDAEAEDARAFGTLGQHGGR